MDEEKKKIIFGTSDKLPTNKKESEKVLILVEEMEKFTSKEPSSDKPKPLLLEYEKMIHPICQASWKRNDGKSM